MRRVPTVLAAAATTLLLAATPAVAHGGGKPEPRPPTVKDVTGGLLGPLSLAIGPHGITYVSQDFAGLLTSVARDGTTTVLHGAEAGHEVGGVSYADRTITFTETFYGESDTSLSAVLKTVRTDRAGTPVGAPTVLADVHAFETASNPDGDVTYGLLETDPACLDQISEDAFLPGTYTGIVDAHPYATTTSRGTTYVADAGMNAILAHDRRGLRTVAVLPPQPLVVTADVAGQVGWPECVVGETYWWEPVPTDVEVGPRGQLYVTALPGGPEDPDVARGVVFTVDPRRGTVRQIATGFVTATDLAVTPTGTVYVAELFGGKISVVERGRLRTLVEVPLPGAVEWTGKGLVATTNALPGEGAPPDGRVTTVSLGKTKGHGGHGGHGGHSGHGGWGSGRDDWRGDRHGLGGWFDRDR